jgi:hypothetical protein
MPTTTILPHPALLQFFEEKIDRLRKTLNAETVRGEAAKILSTLIESVTIYPNSEHGPEAEVVAKVGDLLTWATNDNAACKGGAGRFMALVAGTGTFPAAPLRHQSDITRHFSSPEKKYPSRYPITGKMRRDAGFPGSADRLKELSWQRVIVLVQCHACKSLFLRARTK